MDRRRAWKIPCHSATTFDNGFVLAAAAGPCPLPLAWTQSAMLRWDWLARIVSRGTTLAKPGRSLNAW